MLASDNQLQMQTATSTVKDVSGSSSVSVRLILDSGSQRTYITEKLTKDLNLKLRSPEKLAIITFRTDRPKYIQCKPNKLQLILKDGSSMVLDVSVIPGRVSRVPLNLDDATFLKCEGWESKLADTLPIKSESYPIEMLIGNDYYFDLLLPRKLELGPGLSLFQSKLDWKLGGRYQNVRDRASEPILLACTITVPPLDATLATHMFTGVNSSFLMGKPNLDHFWDLESIGIANSPSTSDDDQALSKFGETVKFAKGRYMVTWPWKDEKPSLPHNYQLVVGRLKSTLRKLEKSPPLLKRYDEIIREQLDRGIIEKVTSDSLEGPIKHYIPHHPVVTPGKSTTKVRIVYDASAKVRKDETCLNDCLYRGPVMLPDLCGLLIRFRISPIGVVGDIEKAFLNVGLQAQDRDVTRFSYMVEKFSERKH